MIKHIEEKHINECVEVIKDSFLTVAKEFGITEKNAPGYVAFSTTYEKLLRQLNEEKRPIFAYFNTDGRIIGYYSLRLKGNSECELNNLCVLSSFRHKGIGRELLEHSFAYSREPGCNIMNISIIEENVKLKLWYESFGFEHVENKKLDFFPFTCGYLKKKL